MSRSRDYLLYLDDIRESCEKVLRYAYGLTFDQFLRDEKTFDAVVRNLAVIGEAVKHIPPETRSRYPDVEWPKIAGLRDVVVHEYFGLDVDILWDVVQNHVPRLLDYVLRILAQESQ
jgi:uncharacterized protein with HEPN domain